MRFSGFSPAAMMFASLAFCAVASANDVYIAQAVAGSANGSSCANAYAAGYFNAAGNWTSGTPTGMQIGPGTTVHLCGGTYSFSGGASCGLSFNGNGNSTSPVTLKADQGAATITAPYWDGSANGGAICASGYNYIVINGNGNLTLQATANGTNLPNQQDYGYGIWAQSSNNLIIEGVTVSNIYVHACSEPVSNCTDEGGQNTGGIAAQGSNVTVSGNVIHDAKWCVTGGVNENATIASRVISGNTIYDCDHGIAVGVAGNNGVLHGLVISGNNIYNFQNWDDAANNNHHDGIHIWSYDSGDSITGAQVYSNLVYGDWGANMNAGIYVEAQTGMPAAYFFNNILQDQSTETHNGCGDICLIANGASIFANTVDSSGAVGRGSVGINSYGTGVYIEDNVIENINEAISFPSGSSWVTVDFNNYYNIGSNGWNQSSSLAAWQSSCSCDIHSSNLNPNLNPNYTPTSDSLALISRGSNLSGLSLSSLDLDKSGFARPPLPTNWTIGAFQYQLGSGNPPAAPTNLSTLAR